MVDHGSLMRRFSTVGAASLVVAALWFAAASASYAQTQTPTPAPTPENSSPAAEAQRQASQPLNNAPVWREVRSGTPQVTTVRGRETNILIQPQEIGRASCRERV